MIHPRRIQVLNDRGPRDGRYVLYWMQQSQRADSNPALEHAAAWANELRLPLVVGFGLMARYPEANARHYAFMLEGLSDVQRRLGERGVLLVGRRGSPPAVARQLGRDAAVVVCDRGYLRHQRAWREQVATSAGCRVEQVEGDVVVPVEVASYKAEFAARTLRPKIHRMIDEYLAGPDEVTVQRESTRLRLGADFDPADPEAVLRGLRVRRSVRAVKRFRGGSAQARRRLGVFLQTRLRGYAEGRSEPGHDGVSFMSPYLHFGQISPVEIALAVGGAKRAPRKDRDAYLEELVVRRELAMNFTQFVPNYDSFDAVPDWARRTLAEHRKDPRPALYPRSQLEAAATHDPYWNAAMREMVHTGYMHNTLRMYWGKKILEWSEDPRGAYETTLYLNNKYFLDGRDPNSYANVAWCFGLHDRPWPERAIYGKVRSMGAAGLDRKYDMQAYLDAVESRCRVEP